MILDFSYVEGGYSNIQGRLGYCFDFLSTSRYNLHFIYLISCPNVS